MGMFDYFKIDNKWIPKEKQLPQDKQDYQTKDFECYLETYEVLEDGSLVRNVCDEGDIMRSENIIPYMYTGGFRFYNINDEFAAWCVNGIVKDVVVVHQDIDFSPHSSNEMLAAISFYKMLSFQKREALKVLCQDICGLKWEDFSKLGFSPRERLTIIYNKLKIEGFSV